jgi:hypothetical protein
MLIAQVADFKEMITGRARRRRRRVTHVATVGMLHLLGNRLNACE